MEPRGSAEVDRGAPWAGFGHWDSGNHAHGPPRAPRTHHGPGQRMPPGNSERLPRNFGTVLPSASHGRPMASRHRASRPRTRPWRWVVRCCRVACREIERRCRRVCSEVESSCLLVRRQVMLRTFLRFSCLYCRLARVHVSRSLCVSVSVDVSTIHARKSASTDFFEKIAFFCARREKSALTYFFAFFTLCSLATASQTCRFVLVNNAHRETQL